jgi:hypothetical protein
MRVADFTTGNAKMRDAIKTLRAKWEATGQDWHDAVSRQFEEKYLSILDPEILATIERLNRLSQAVAAAERDCSPEQRGL